MVIPIAAEAVVIKAMVCDDNCSKRSFSANPVNPQIIRTIQTYTRYFIADTP
jgi:hypothetical protein